MQTVGLCSALIEAQVFYRGALTIPRFPRYFAFQEQWFSLRSENRYYQDRYSRNKAVNNIQLETVHIQKEMGVNANKAYNNNVRERNEPRT